MDHSDYKKNGSHNKQWVVPAEQTTHTSLVAKHYGLELICHGYNGQGWWYSRSQLFKQIAANPDLLDQTLAIVFFHTDWHRINTATQDVNTIYSILNTKNFKSTDFDNAHINWFKHLYDRDFQEWAGQQWFEELTRDFSHVKQVHFHSFEGTNNYNHLLLGQRFVTPLIDISHNELAGSKKEIMDFMIVDNRANHLSDKNNQALADIIIDAVDNYQHKSHELAMSSFYF
jgi:hypothetical protein